MHVPPADRQAIDESLRTIQTAGTNTSRDTLRTALARVAGIAAMVGVPVIESIRKVLAALGM